MTDYEQMMEDREQWWLNRMARNGYKVDILEQDFDVVLYKTQKRDFYSEDICFHVWAGPFRHEATEDYAEAVETYDRERGAETNDG